MRQRLLRTSHSHPFLVHSAALWNRLQRSTTGLAVGMVGKGEGKGVGCCEVKMVGLDDGTCVLK